MMKHVNVNVMVRNILLIKLVQLQGSTKPKSIDQNFQNSIDVKNVNNFQNCVGIGGPEGGGFSFQKARSQTWRQLYVDLCGSVGSVDNLFSWNESMFLEFKSSPNKKLKICENVYFSEMYTETSDTIIYIFI